MKPQLNVHQLIEPTICGKGPTLPCSDSDTRNTKRGRTILSPPRQL